MSEATTKTRTETRLEIILDFETILEKHFWGGQPEGVDTPTLILDFLRRIENSEEAVRLRGLSEGI